MKRWLFKQYNIPGLGAFMDSVYTSTPLFSAVNLISVLVLLYTAVQEKWFPWLSMSLFFLVLFIGLLIVVLMVYKFLIRSIWAFRSSQMGDMYTMLEEMYKDWKEKKECQSVEGVEKNTQTQFLK